MGYRLSPTPYFKKKYVKLVKQNTVLKDKTLKVFEILQINPFTPALKTHKVDSKVKNGVFSSSITGDLRVIWQFCEDEIDVLDLLDIGGHSGTNKVYK
jgi:mRNA-degrading endonuclease YafQ of YafQ-DinJ toxin-antitoxin module